MPGQATPTFLGIDYGLARIGLAYASSLTTIAQPLPTLKNKGQDKAIESLITLIREKDIHTVIIGIPLGEEGKKTQMSETVESFITAFSGQLEQMNLSVNIIRVNETMTSYAAYENLLAKGLSHQKIKPILDSEAARIMLQEYLDR